MLANFGARGGRIGLLGGANKRVELAIESGPVAISTHLTAGVTALFTAWTLGTLD